MELLFGLAFIGLIVYYLLKRNKRKEQELEILLQSITRDRQRAAERSQQQTTISAQKQLIFTYTDWDDITETKRIIPYYKSEYFLEGYCLDTEENALFDVNRIISFEDNGKEIFDSLTSDPSILTHDEVEDRSFYNSNSYQRPTNIEQKEHKDWDESNPFEIFIRYKNADGKTKNRVIVLINYDQKVINGYCKMAKGLRTFIFDRIQIFYKDSRDRLENFRSNTHFDRDILTISFVDCDEKTFVDYKAKGRIYNYRALKTITKNTSIVVFELELTESQIERAEENQCALVKADDFSHFLETGEIRAALNKD